MVLSAELAHTPAFATDPPPFHLRRVSAAESGRWMQLWASQDRRCSRLFELHVVDARQLETCMRSCLAALPAPDLQQLAAAEGAQREASCLLLDVAAHVIQRLLQQLPRLPRPADGPSPDAPPRRNLHVAPLLVLVNMEGIKRRTPRSGEAGGTAADRLLVRCVWPLAQACVLVLLTEHPWHVYVAKNEEQALRFAEAVARVVDERALLSCAL